MKPDINKSETKFTVDKNQIRFGMGSIKNVGTNAVEEIVNEREKNGKYKDFSDFCERIKDKGVNKKCVESLIKSGVFDNLGETRKTLITSFEGIIDMIADTNKKSLAGQVSMFDLASNDNKTLEMKYQYNIFPEYDKKELLSMEKEMLGLYISGHPLENIRNQIEDLVTINTNQLRQLNNLENEIEERKTDSDFCDNQDVVYAGIIISVKKKYTKANKLMAFITVEDLYGPTEIIVFDSCYQACAPILIEENIVLIEGKLSIREEEDPKIVARKISEFSNNKSNIFKIDITNLNKENKNKLKGAIHFFQGEKNNMQLVIKNGEKLDKAGGIYITEEITKQFEELIGKENVKIS